MVDQGNASHLGKIYFLKHLLTGAHSASLVGHCRTETTFTLMVCFVVTPHTAVFSVVN